MLSLGGSQRTIASQLQAVCLNCVAQGKFPLQESLADDLTHGACGFAEQLGRHTKLKHLSTTFTAAGDQVAYVDIATTSAELMRRYCSVRGLWRLVKSGRP